MIIPENVIRPHLAHRSAMIHPIITVLAYIAPIFVVGIMGIILGPIIYGFLLAVYRIYKQEIVPMNRVSFMSCNNKSKCMDALIICPMIFNLFVIVIRKHCSMALTCSALYLSLHRSFRTNGASIL